MIAKLYKNQDGFTLLEVVISVAVLSILSVFILQLFIASANANKRAQNIDIASSKAQAVIEEFKTLDETEAYAQTQWYDGRWQETEGEGVFRMETTVGMIEAEGLDAAGTMFNITVRVVDTSASMNMFADKTKDTETVLVEYTRDKYFRDR